MNQRVLKMILEHATIREKRKSFYRVVLFRVVKLIGISEQKTAVHRHE